MSEDYCDLCDLPLSTCVHGMPPAPKVEAPAPTPRATRASAPRTPSRTAKSKAAKAALEVPVRRTARKWSPPEFFVPHVVAVLQEAGGELDNESLFEAVEARIGEQFLDGDRGSTPEGELRWRRAARVARRNLAADGLMETGTPGSWVLTGAGLAHDGDFTL